jgi:hypothetical protein
VGVGVVKYIGNAEEVRPLQVKHITLLKSEPYKEEIRQILEAVRANQLLPTNCKFLLKFLLGI